ncbi:MAG: hypothetical protein IPP69_10870 [Flavobacteriales bacterium]|nr:hypothetical protein [Flavobacteriales bacterium]
MINRIDSGAYSSCEVKNSTRTCHIYINKIETESQHQTSLDFYTVLGERNKEIASAKTDSMEHMVNLIFDFIEGENLIELYRRYDFVDRKKRKLILLQTLINDVYPAMKEIAVNRIVEDILSYPELEFEDGERLCRIHYHASKEFPRWIYFWNGTRIFETSNPHDAINAQIAMRWVLEKVRPSELNMDYPEIDTGKLAQFYEQGKGLEGEFTLSWEESIKNLKQGEHHEKVRKLFKQFEKAGYYQLFRTNANSWTFVMTRSKKNLKLSDQPFISFRFYENKSEVSVKDIHGTLHRFEEIELTSEMKRIIQELQDIQIQ